MSTGLVEHHIVAWVDGLRVTRLFKWTRKGRPPQMLLSIVWNDIAHEVRLGTRVSQITRRGRI